MHTPHVLSGHSLSPCTATVLFDWHAGLTSNMALGRL